MNANAHIHTLQAVEGSPPKSEGETSQHSHRRMDGDFSGECAQSDLGSQQSGRKVETGLRIG